jgi:hypothetical protein
MLRRAYAVLVCIVMLITSSYGLAALREFSTIRVGPAVMASTGATPPADRGVPKITWVIDFAEYAGGSIEAWLHTKGFRLEHGAADPAALALSHHAGALVVEAKQPVRGVCGQ